MEEQHEAAGTQARIAPLINELTCDDVIACQNARRSLVDIGQQAVPSLIGALKDRREWVRWEAARALGEIGGPQATEALLESLEGDSFEIRWLAAEGLIRAGREVVRPLLGALLEHPDSVWLRQGAHRVFRDFEHADLRDILHPVSEAIESDDPAVRVPVAVKEALDRLPMR